MRLVYGEIQDGLVFIDEGEAHDLVQLHRALGKARTWGGFKAQAPSHWYEDAVERYNGQRAYEDDDDGINLVDEEPATEASFLADEIPGHGDGDWPAWPAGSMLSWIPKEIQNRFGSMEPTPISGDYLYLPPQKEEEILSAMREHGYDCVRDDDLIWRASGY